MSIIKLNLTNYYISYLLIIPLTVFTFSGKVTTYMLEYGIVKLIMAYHFDSEYPFFMDNHFLKINRLYSF